MDYRIKDRKRLVAEIEAAGRTGATVRELAASTGIHPDTVDAYARTAYRNREVKKETLDCTTRYFGRSVDLKVSSGFARSMKKLWDAKRGAKTKMRADCKPIITVGPTVTGSRWSTTAPEPVFSALGIGRYDAADTWATRMQRARECSTS